MLNIWPKRCPLKRKIESYLSRWVEQPGGERGALIVRGVRQTGKTYSVKQFLSENFEGQNHTFDFEKDEILKEVVLGCSSLDAILDQLSISARSKLKEAGRLALFFDEIQAVPNLIRFLRYFKEDYPHIHVIAAGSYLEMMFDQIGSFPVGRVSYYFMSPMDFEEFLWSRGFEFESQALGKISGLSGDDSDAILTQLKNELLLSHEKLVNLALEYEVCGGMPAAVKILNQTSDLVQVREFQNDILSTYKEDFIKYVTAGVVSETVHENMLKVLDSMETLAKRVKYSKISSSHSETVKKAITILEKIGLIHKVHFSNSFDSPLSSGKNSSDFRIFFCDSGLFHAMVSSELPTVITPDIHFSNDGVLGEYFLIGELIKRSDPKKKGHDVYFWENKKKKDGAEIDALFIKGEFLFACDAKRRHQKVSASLRSYRERFDRHDSQRKQSLLCIVSSMDPLNQLQDRVLNLPFYLTPFLVG